MKKGEALKKIIILLLFLTILLVGCKPEFGPGRAIAKAPVFMRLDQCVNHDWHGHDIIFRSASKNLLSFRNRCEGRAGFPDFSIVGYTLEQPLSRNNMVALTSCYHEELRAEPRLFEEQMPQDFWGFIPEIVKPKHTYRDHMVHAGKEYGCPAGYKKERELGYAFAEEIPGHTIPIYQLYADDWKKGQWGHVLYNKKSLFSRTKYRYSGFVGHLLKMPELPAAFKPEPVQEAPVIQEEPAFECKGIQKVIGIGEAKDLELFRIHYDALLKSISRKKIVVLNVNNQKISIKKGQSKLADDDNLKITLLDMQGRKSAEFCFEAAGERCCQLKDDKARYLEPAECIGRQGEIEDKEFCDKEICCKWEGTLTLKTRAECSDLKESRLYSRKECPGTGPSPTCHEIEKQCENKIRFVEELCRLDEHVIKEQVEELKKKNKGLKEYLNKLELEYQDYVSQNRITGQTVSASPSLRNNGLIKIWQCRIDERPMQSLDSSDCAGYPLMPEQGYLLPGNYMRRNNINTQKILRCVPQGTDVWHSVKAYWAVEKCPQIPWSETKQYSEIIGYSLKTQEPGTEEVFACRSKYDKFGRPRAGVCEFLTTDPGCNNLQSYQYKKSLGFWPQSTGWTHAEPAREEEKPAAEILDMYSCRTERSSPLRFDNFAFVHSSGSAYNLQKPCPEGSEAALTVGKVPAQQKKGTTKIVLCTDRTKHNDKQVFFNKCPPGKDFVYDLGYVWKTKPKEGETIPITQCKVRDRSGEEMLTPGIGCPPGADMIISFYVLPFKKAEPAKKHPPCPPAEAAEIKADCEKQAKEQRQRCYDEVIAKAKQELEKAKEEHERLMSKIKELQGYMAQ